jgi:hypothetical protein
MKITACPKCGSRNIFQGRLKEGVLTGYTSREVCRDCGYRGSPIIFDSEKDYKIFFEQLKKEDTSEESDDISDLSKKDKQILEDLKDIKDEPDDVKEKDSKLLKNPCSSLGFVLFIAGILATAGTIGSLLIFTGILVIVGLILIVVGIAGPKEEDLQKENIRNKMKSLPFIAGVLLILNGLIGGFIYFLYLIVAIDPFTFAPEELTLIFINHQSYWIILFSIEIIFCLVSLMGGIFSVFRRKWGVAILGAVLGTFVMTPFYIITVISLISLILIAYSRYLFRK